MAPPRKQRRVRRTPPAAQAQLPVSSTQSIPPELCGVICSLVGRDTLLHLSLVSRNFSGQAQRLIFHNVDLRPCSHKVLRSWCTSVDKNPSLGPYVRRLSIADSDIHDLAGPLTRALKRCTNLKRLATHTGALWDAQGDTHASILLKAPFQLTHFSNSYFRPDFLNGFWDRQEDIELLSLPLPCMLGTAKQNGFPCYEDQLPKLVALEVHGPSALPDHARPLKRIQLRMGQHPGMRSGLAQLSRFAGTLTTVNIQQYALLSLEELIELIVDAVPNLVHLGLAEQQTKAGWQDIPPTMQAHRYQPHPGRVLARLRRLETFVLLVYHINGLTATIGHGRPLTYVFAHPPAVARSFMALCPQLKEVIVGGYPIISEDVEGGSVEWGERTCLLRRIGGRDVRVNGARHEDDEEDEEFEEEVGEKFDFRAMGRFWDV